MKSALTLICPDITAGEISAVERLLSDRAAIPNIAYVASEGGPVLELARAFAEFIAGSVKDLPPYAVTYATSRRWSTVALHAICVSSATGAIYGLLRCASAQGGEVLTTSLNFQGVVNAILAAGAVPRFVDIERSGLCMDAGKLERAVTKRTRAIIVTHMNRCVDLSPILDMLKRKRLSIPVIQDASLAQASRCGGLPPGLINPGSGSATVFSLASSKIISGLGGAVVLANEEPVVGRLLSFAYQGNALSGGEELAMPGFNLKMNDMNASIALRMLSRREEIISRRRVLKKIFDSELEPLVGRGLVGLQDVGDDSVVTHYAVLVNRRRLLVERLRESHGVPIGMWHVHHRQKIYRRERWASRSKLPVSDFVASRLLFLPFHTGLTDEEASRICRAVVEEVQR